MDSATYKFSLQYLRQNPVQSFFSYALLSLNLCAAFPNAKPLTSELKSFLLYKVWPVVFLSIWCLLVPMVAGKILQYKNNKDWEQLLDITHMFFVGCYALYIAFFVQQTSKNFKNTVDTITNTFVTTGNIVFKDLFVYVYFIVSLSIAFACFLGGCVFYGDVPVPLLVPFTDNDKDYTLEVFLFIWAYEGVAAVYIFLTLGILGPFVIVASICICKELDYLIEAMDHLKYVYGGDDILMRVYKKEFDDYSVRKHSPKQLLSVTCYTEKDCKQFVSELVEHHVSIKRTLKEVSRIHSFLMMGQSLFTVVHSCFVAFNMYYTKNLTKGVIKSTPILFLSYYMMFAYCWNGQRLTDKFVELYRALYRSPWYRFPHSFKTSLVLMMEVYKEPVCLTAGGLFPINLGRFTTCVQQSLSYILILDTLLTPHQQEN